MLRREYDSFYIDGAWHKATGPDTFTVISPSTGSPIGSVPSATVAEIDLAVAAARRAFDTTDWPTRPAAERAELCEALAQRLFDHKSELSDLLVDELGCTRAAADVYQATAPTLHWNYNAALARDYAYAEKRSTDLGPLAGGATSGFIMQYETNSVVFKEPIGVVAALGAFNFPLAGTAQKVAPAVAAGCTVVIKVPEQDPLAIMAMGDLITEAGIPPGVINIVAAGPDVSAHLVSHPDVDMVSFTGSTETGARIGEACGKRIRPAVLELGGKSAAIILPDADIDGALPELLSASAITSNGQSCVCQSRILVPRDRHDEIVQRLVDGFAGIKVGDPNDPEVALGPLISEAHRERVLGFVRRAVEQGATLAFGGGVPEGLDKGWFVEPTLLIGVTRDMEIAQEEVFGPVIAVLAYDSEEEAIEIANASRYGLSGTVFTADLEHGFDIARRIRVGLFGINMLSVDFNAPFGGLKDSGYGREHGPAGFESYLTTKTVPVASGVSIPDSVLTGQVTAGA
ncbi:aldehyde dehydrogenase [Rhodococcus qingshengii]|uniref:aldehyde dehydrogenase n=1 Tax=Rhodococcus qingshengii TaxID=334542 RepID=UPI001BEC636B|nr:aldehyde dehydrogenase [Rhodococcus qingshengii]MBT2271379.1 aldehyde dehydrogenase [Rhodococcus qingshengii]